MYDEEGEEKKQDLVESDDYVRKPIKEVLTAEERKKKRNARKSKGGKDIGGSQRARVNVEELADEKFSSLLSRNEDDLLQFVAKVNRVYQDLLKRPAPFMTFVFCGMQSAGKSTIMERFLNSVLNIVQAGTGTRCPLDTTCIHDSTKVEPSCELWGEELQDTFHGKDLPVDEVFKRINAHTMMLGNEDRFSTKPICLVYRANNVQNMRFVDTPDLLRCQKELKLLKDRQNLSDPKNLRNVVNRMLFRIQEKIQSYLDGNLEVGQKFPDKLQTLHDELDEEEDSEWCDRELNIHTAKEDGWRDRMAKLEELPDQIQADQLFLGGKQYQRALEFFRVIMIDALPDPFELKDQVANVTGYLCGGLQHENWERAMVEITRVCLKDVSEPGMNFIVKHVGCIFRRLFMVALNDVRQGEEFSAEFQLIPTGLERFLVGEFDEMLWDLLVKASSELNSSMEPMYSTIDPNLLDYCKVSKQELENGEKEEKKTWFQSFKDVTQLVREKHKKHATEKKSFLPDQRTAMITEEETEMILERSFEYILAMSEFNLIVCKFQLNHHLYEGFKKSLRSTLMSRINEANWEELTQPNADVAHRIAEIEGQIKGLRDSLLDVQRMQRSL
ncbi:hypothetical protein FisN_16Lh254 [Fistulifera solaris]|uniref:Dynamin N-terminal domain-containing protein n=1 Tax=Fistulifera solaris TaxID=1519565 RepID=A0A1Z5J6I7_FISSO|nr:hypothetical protein FisN_16Lh254 [Fistulifera solaris]|eukprot:GAX09559.1 hypothetical protein FisN_16Lh254 [Fistulifera solaris]